MKGNSGSVIGRVARSILLAASALFYLQFGFQALWHSVPQGILALVGAIVLGWGVVLTIRGGSASRIVFLGTVPLVLFHGVFTLIEPGELPFLIGSTPVPLIAAIAWLITGRPGRSSQDPTVRASVG